MKALITAGGRATRLRPITWTLNKHLIPLANRTMLAYAIEKIVEAGVTDIGINVNEGEKEIQAALGDGSAFGARITYIEQVGGPKGLGHILSCAKPFLGTEPFIFYLGDNIILGSIKRFVERFNTDKLDGLLALSKVRDPQRFGVPEMKDGRIIRVIEKPVNPPSEFAVTGIYLYTSKVFEAVEAIKPSPRGEYEISDVHTWLIENGANIGYEEITGWWKDTGKPEDLLEGNALLLNERHPDTMKLGGEAAKSAVIQGKVEIGEGSIIGERVLIRGPVSIGKNCNISDAYIGPYTSLGNDVTVTQTEIEHSIVFDGANIHAGKRIVDSIIGKNATVGNVRDTLPLGHRLIVGDNAQVEL